MISFDQPIISDVRDRPNVEEIKESKTNFQDVNIFQWTEIWHAQKSVWLIIVLFNNFNLYYNFRAENIAYWKNAFRVTSFDYQKFINSLLKDNFIEQLLITILNMHTSMLWGMPLNKHDCILTVVVMLDCRVVRTSSL